MSRIISSVFLFLLSGAVAAQDATALLKRVSAAMGADQVSTLRIVAGGTANAFGQGFRAGGVGPQLNVSLTRSIAYDSASMSDALVLSRAENPPRGGTGVPVFGEQRPVQLTSGAMAWNQVGPAIAATPVALEDRQHQLWITPHGVVKAAQRSRATVGWVERGGKPLAAISFSEAGRYLATAYVDESNLVVRVESRFPNPVLGDVAVETDYSEYRDYGGVKFPGRIRQRIGGHPALDLAVSEVQPNAPVAIEVPEVVRQPLAVRSEKAADGIWYVAGASHHSVAVEMRDHVVVIEGPLFDGRALPVIEEVKKLIPGKPIRYVVNTHYHFDHAGGLRAFAAEGATIVTHTLNRAYFEKAWASAQWKIKPDSLARSGRKAAFKPVAAKTALGDGERVLELHPIEGNLHNEGILLAWLPKERLLIEVDVYTPLPPNAPAPAKPNPVNVNLMENIERLKLDVDRILPLHGRIVPLAELRRTIGRD